jgi:cytidylate kinase
MSGTTQRERPVIAIDGPSGVGKSTLASRLAHALDFTKLDTGAMYRALALKALEADMDFEHEGPLFALAGATRIVLEPMTHTTRVVMDGRDVTQRLREPDVTQAASRVSVHPKVREWMVARQRALGDLGGVVMEGRDIGTVVFPDAEVKFFLEASEEARADRRFREEAARHAGRTTTEQTEQQVRQMIHDRDQRDRTRAASPLVAAADAVVLDTTALDLDQVLARSLEIIAARFPHLPVRREL